MVPRRWYEPLTRVEQDQRDSEIAVKGRAASLAGKMKKIPHDEIKKRLGI